MGPDIKWAKGPGPPQAFALTAAKLRAAPLDYQPQLRFVPPAKPENNVNSAPLKCYAHDCPASPQGTH